MVRREAAAVAEIELERRTVGEDGPEHVTLRGPTLHAAFGSNLEPVRAAEQDLDALIALGDIEHRIAAPGPRSKLEVGSGDVHLEMLARAADARSRQQHERHQQSKEWQTSQG